MEHLLINQEQFPQLVSRTGSENIASLIVDFQKKHYREMKLRAEAEIEGLGPEIIRMLLNGRVHLSLLLNSPGGYRHLMWDPISVCSLIIRNGGFADSYVTDKACSAAALFFQRSHRRYALRHSDFLWHTSSHADDDERKSQFLSYARFLVQNTRQALRKMIMEYMQKTASKVEDRHEIFARAREGVIVRGIIKRFYLALGSYGVDITEKYLPHVEPDRQARLPLKLSPNQFARNAEVLYLLKYFSREEIVKHLAYVREEREKQIQELKEKVQAGVERLLMEERELLETEQEQKWDAAQREAKKVFNSLEFIKRTAERGNVRSKEIGHLLQAQLCINFEEPREAFDKKKLIRVKGVFPASLISTIREELGKNPTVEGEDETLYYYLSLQEGALLDQLLRMIYEKSIEHWRSFAKALHPFGLEEREELIIPYEFCMGRGRRAFRVSFQVGSLASLRIGVRSAREIEEYPLGYRQALIDRLDFETAPMHRGRQTCFQKKLDVNIFDKSDCDLVITLLRDLERFMEEWDEKA